MYPGARPISTTLFGHPVFAGIHFATEGTEITESFCAEQKLPVLFGRNGQMPAATGKVAEDRHYRLARCDHTAIQAKASNVNVIGSGTSAIAPSSAPVPAAVAPYRERQ